MHDDRQHHAGICGDNRAIVRADVLRWSLAAMAVLSAYAAGAVSLYSYEAAPERLAGAPPAIMLELAAEPAAPDAQTVSETLQPAVQARAPQTEPEPENGVPLQRSQADSIAKKAPELKQKPEQENNRAEQKPAKKHQQKQHREQAAKTAARERRSQKSSAPEVDAKSSRTLSGPMNSRSEGFNGKSDKAWSDRVYRRIQSVGRRMQRQLPGARGVAYIFFAYDAAGRISTASISRSSGNAGIDQLALRIVKHASPLPEPPDAGSKTVPVRVN